MAKETEPHPRADHKAITAESHETQSSMPLMMVSKLSKYVTNAGWKNYVKQLEFSFKGNGITDTQRKKAIFMANISTETYQIIKDLVAMSKLSDIQVTYEWVVSVMKNHAKSERPALVSRYKFDNRVPQQQESLANYVKSLKHLANKYKFSDEMRNELSDRFIAGIWDDQILHLLLTEKLADFTFDKAIQKCTVIEQASKDIDTLRGEENTATTVTELCPLNNAQVCPVVLKRKRTDVWVTTYLRNVFSRQPRAPHATR